MNDVPQIAVLLVCLTAGAAAGVLYEPACAVRALVPHKWAGIAADILFFLSSIHKLRTQAKCQKPPCSAPACIIQLSGEKRKYSV